MPRTRQTAKKSAGAPAPAVFLAVRRQQQASKKKKRNAQNAPASLGGVGFDLIETENEEPCVVLCRGQRIEPGTWCSSCREGGNLQDCSLCTRSFCEDCINFPTNKDNDFVCPSCHIKRGPKKRNAGPYTLKVKAATTTRELWPEICLDPLVVFSITLQGMSSLENPARMIYNHLWTYMKGNIVYVALNFNFGDDESVALYHQRLDIVLDTLENGILKDFQRFSIFFYSHSTPQTGLLHIAPNNSAATSITEAFDLIFPDRFRRLLQQRDENLLVLLSCGGIVCVDESRKELEAFSATRLFSQILAFSTLGFMPTFSIAFFVTFAYNRFLYGKNDVGSALRDDEQLGPHTDLLCFQCDAKGHSIKITTTRYFWSHPGQKPFGNPLPTQCQCHGLRTLVVVKKTKDRIFLKCRATDCTHELAFDRPPDAEFVTGEYRDDGHHGQWLKVTQVL